ncbi:MAG: hypothetical protein QMD07_02165 [Thermodesulfovibrionales bacterium]|nr:hypothetical protein [Thermodesulfovibrionales bacterium]
MSCLRLRIYIAAALILILGLISGCSREEKYGQAISKDAPIVKVKDIHLDPALEGKVVNLEGKILSQCLSIGCWFYFTDETGAILIDLAPAGLSITTKNQIGRNAKVTGIVKKNGDYKIIAQGVEIK